MSCLFAVTTDLPALRALRTQSPAGSRPPANSTTTSAPDARTSLKSSVHWTDRGTQGTRFLATSRLKMCVSSNPLGLRSQSIFATELPTVPKPRMATLRLVDDRSSPGVAGDVFFSAVGLLVIPAKSLLQR